MKTFILTSLALAAILLSNSLAAHGTDQPGAHHSAQATAVVKEQKPWGIAGDAKAVTRTVTIRMLDTMRFEPRHIDVQEGETLKLVIRNEGKMLHELVIGTSQELQAHAAQMLKFPNMAHDEPYMAHVATGKTGQLVWTFNRAGEFQFACLIPGHFQAGMLGTLTVKPKAPVLAAATPVAPSVTSVQPVEPALNPWSQGEVRRLDLETKKITLKHGPLANLGMDAMSMVFQLRGEAVAAAKAIKVGEAVEFVAAYDKGAYLVTQIRLHKKEVSQ